MNELGLGMVFSAKDLATGVMTKVGKGLLDVEGRSSDAGKAIGKHFQAFSVGMSTLGVGASMLGTAFGLAGVSGKFNEQVASVGAVANANAEELKALHDAAIEAGVATQFSPTQAVVGLGDLAQAGYSAQESISLLNPVLNLAAGSLGALSPSGAAGLASQTMKAFKIPIEQAGITMDKLLQSVNAFALSADELPLALGTAARGASVMNQSLDETLIALGLVKNVVPGVERASTSVAVAMEKMVNPETATALKAQGVAVADTQGKFRPFLNVIQDLIPALNKMGTEQKKAAFLVKTFGTEALGGIQAILGQVTNGIKDNTGATVTGAAAIDYLRKSFSNAGGTAQQFADKMLDTFEGQKKLMGGSMETLAILLGEPFEKALKPVVAAVLGVLNNVLSFVKSMPDGMKNFIAKLVLVVGSVLSLVGGLIAAKAAVAMFAYGMSALGMTVGGVIATLAPALLILGAIAGAIYAIKYAVDNNIGGMGEQWGLFKSVIFNVKLAFEALEQLFTDGGLSGDAATGYFNDSPAVKFAIKIYVIFNQLKTFFDSFVKGVTDRFDTMGPTFQAAAAAVERLLKAFGFADDIDVAKNTEDMAAWGKAGEKAGNAIAGAIDWLVKSMTKAVDFVTGFVENFKSISSSAAEMKPAFADIAESVNKIGEAFGQSGEKSKNGVSDWRKFGQDVAAILGFVVSMVSTVVAEVGAQFKHFGTFFSGLANIFNGFATRDWSRVWLGLKQVAASSLQSILSLLGMVVEQIAKAADFLGRIVGKDFGLAKGVQDVRKSINDALTIDDPAKLGPTAKDAMPGETMPKDLVDFYAMPTVDQLPYAPTVDNVATGQAAATAAGAALDVESVNAAIASLKAAKEGTTSFDITMQVNEEVLGRIAAKGQAANKAGAGGMIPVVVQ